ncbi:acyl-CoA dehydrogenase family protein [Microbacterium aurantiacum]|uniref:Acyl-CoA/acyl-ACP dehydrogenase n=1 Tax=Microbacterium aurantiacum TaxID=162393 RepID=A0ABT8FVN7_9MICO|nr:acyl-CoA dehydrogenase family protein [Microbacterium aurantiacum]MDN4465374.1 acyl-CoA/acyl-ACP dehydrogenase [Microbacterium aurantiacum]
MDLLPTEDQLQISDTVGELFQRVLPKELLRARAVEPDAITREDWATCMETGLLALGVAEDRGGVGLGLAEEALAFREIGRHLAPGPFLSSLLAARIAAEAGDAALYESIVSGETQVGLVVMRPSATFVDGTLAGEVYLLDATAADLVLAVGADGASLIPRTALADVGAVDAIDPGTRLESARADSVRGILDCADPGIRARGLVLAAAILAGVAEACRDAATEHAKTREQFGRPIGVNQAIKHRCADMAVQSDAATSQVFYAAATMDAAYADAAFQAAVAHLVAAHAAIENSQNTVQVHGGMGYTWEHDSHLYVKRARVWASALGLTDDDCELVLSAVVV